MTAIAGSSPRLHRFTAREFERMRRLGFLPQGAEFAEGRVFYRQGKDLRPVLFTADEYDRLGQSGLLPERGVELIEGEIVTMSPVGPLHVSVVYRLTNLMARRIPEDYGVSVQNPLRLSDSTEPQPDLMVLRPRPDGYRKALPWPEDVALLIEAGDTTASDDKRTKLPKYARNGIAEVWLFDLQERVAEVYRQPSARGYRDGKRYGLGDRLQPLHLPGVEVDLSAHFSEELRRVLETERTIEGLERETGRERDLER